MKKRALEPRYSRDRVRRLERVARAAGILCMSFVFTEPRLTPMQERHAQRIRRDVPKLLTR